MSASPTSRASRPRRGAVLLVVLAALVVLGAASGALAVEARAARHAATRALAARRALDAADAVVAATLPAWPSLALDALADGDVRADTVAVAPDLVVARHVARLSPDAALVTATAVARPVGVERPLARRRVQRLVALEPVAAPAGAALLTAAPLRADAGVTLDGRDTIPAGWGCAPEDTASVPAVAHAPDAPPALDASLAGASPHVVADSALAALLPPAPDLVGRAGVRPPAFVATRPLVVRPVTGVTLRATSRADGACDAADSLNWGDPRRPSECAARLPLVHVAGDLVAPRGAGQGTLVVDGDLVLDGDWEHWGVVAVGGRIVARGMGNRVVGALLLRGRDTTAHELSSLAVRFSSCVAGRALRAAGVVRPVGERGWREGW